MNGSLNAYAWMHECRSAWNDQVINEVLLWPHITDGKKTETLKKQCGSHAEKKRVGYKCGSHAGIIACTLPHLSQTGPAHVLWQIALWPQASISVDPKGARKASNAWLASLPSLSANCISALRFPRVSYQPTRTARKMHLARNHPESMETAMRKQNGRTAPPRSVLRRDGLTGHHDVMARSAKNCNAQWKCMCWPAWPTGSKRHQARMKHKSDEKAISRSRTTSSIWSKVASKKTRAAVKKAFPHCFSQWICVNQCGTAVWVSAASDTGSWQ